MSKEGAGCVCAAQRTGCKLILENPLGGILVKSQHPAHGWTQGWIQAWPLQRNLALLLLQPLRAGTDFCVSPALHSRIFLLPAPGISNSTLRSCLLRVN